MTYLVWIIAAAVVQLHFFERFLNYQDELEDQELQNVTGLNDFGYLDWGSDIVSQHLVTFLESLDLTAAEGPH